MTSEELKNRTKMYAIQCAKLTIAIPANEINKVYSNQLIRCSSSVGANYRAAIRAKSSADFINKLKIVEEELDESLFFMELIEVFNPSFIKEIEINHNEGEQLLKIIVASITTAKNNIKNHKS